MSASAYALAAIALLAVYVAALLLASLLGELEPPRRRRQRFR